MRQKELSRKIEMTWYEELWPRRVVLHVLLVLLVYIIVSSNAKKRNNKKFSTYKERSLTNTFQSCYSYTSSIIIENQLCPCEQFTCNAFLQTWKNMEDYPLINDSLVLTILS